MERLVLHVSRLLLTQYLIEENHMVTLVVINQGAEQ